MFAYYIYYFSEKLLELGFRIFIILLFISLSALAQKKYPNNYFKKPLDIPMYLAGTFGELRTNHFHSGIDIKTQHQEGLSVFASAEGYVSRIKISLWGYGKALYITHPNGYVSVYAHLKKFSPKIEKYIKEKQYEKQSYTIQEFPKNNELVVSQGEIIAYSGNTGGSSAPHLHFEIRDEHSNPINPMLFGFQFKDEINPIISDLVVYPLNDSSAVNESNLPLQINIKEKSNTELIADKIYAYGKIGFGVKTFDRLDGALNKNGIYSMELFLNGQQKYGHKVATFSFAESKHLNLLIDYQRYASIKQRIQRCFIVDENPLSIYENVIDNGVSTINDGYNYNAKILVKDFNGNIKSLTIPIRGEKQKIKIKSETIITDYEIKKNEKSKFDFENTSISFNENTFYENLYLDINAKKDTLNIQYKPVPVLKSFYINFNVKDYENKDQLYVAKLNNGYPSYVSTAKKGDIFTARTKSFGNYTLAYDTIKPTLSLSNFRDKQWMTNFKSLVIKISDKGTGINNYTAEIDGEWILMEYNPRKKTLTYDFSDKKFIKAKHLIKVTTTDNVGNTNSITATFYRKK